jgi:hypothetical protein
MKSVILYSTNEPTGREQSIVLPGGARIFIRTEVVDGDPEEALAAAKPRHGEIVLNTIPYPA